MSKRSLVMVSWLAFVFGLLWVYTHHLTGWAAVLVLVLPLILGVLSAMYGL